MMQTLSSFLGIDRRREVQSADPRSLYAATNVRLTPGAVLRTRPGTRRLAALPDGCDGLFSDGARLHTVAPAGYVEIDTFPATGVRINRIGNGTVYPRNDVRLIAAELWDGVPYVVIQRVSTGAIEHHYISTTPPVPGNPVNTIVALPFTPGAALVKLARKLWAPDDAGRVWFSSTQFGPTDWTAPADAGFLPVGQHAPSATLPTGLGVYRSRLAVQFPDLTQIWSVDPDPANHGLDPDNGVLNGAGTITPSLTANVLGDLFYFSTGGFRSLAAGEGNALATEGDVGAPIYDLTSELDPTTADAAVWWQALGTYCAAFDGIIYAFTFDRANQVSGWTVWELPFQVSDLTTLNGKMYAMVSGAVVYEFDPILATDAGTPINWSVTTQHLLGGGRGVPISGLKQWQRAQIRQTGDCVLSYLPEPRDRDIIVRAGPIQGLRQPFEGVMIPALSDGLALRFDGTGRWQLDGLTVVFNPAG